MKTHLLSRMGATALLAGYHINTTISGIARVEVRGSHKSEVLTVTWQKASATAPMRLAAIEAGDGTLLPLYPRDQRGPAAGGWDARRRRPRLAPP